MMNDQLERPSGAQRTPTAPAGTDHGDEIVRFELRSGPPPRLGVDGELDLSGGVAFRAAIDGLIELVQLGAGDVAAIDLSEVRFMDSIGIRELLMGKERAAVAHQELVLVDPSRSVIRPLEMSGVHHLFRIESAAPSPAPGVSSPRCGG